MKTRHETELSSWIEKSIVFPVREKTTADYTDTVVRPVVKSWLVSSRQMTSAIFAPPTTDGSMGDSGE
jgi:hypothetical protein